MPSVVATWHQVVQTVVQLAMNSKCINTDPDGAISAVNGNPYTCKGEMRVDITYMFPEIFCIIIYLTCLFNSAGTGICICTFPFLQQKPGCLILKPHRTIVTTIRDISQFMLLWQVLVDEVIWIIICHTICS
jgi:hypothetical protein